MRSLFRYFAKHHVFFLFLILETIAMVLLFNYNNYQKVRFLNSSNRISASIYESYNSVVDYFNLSEVNEELALENSRLRGELEKYIPAVNSIDSVKSIIQGADQKYLFTSAEVINNSVNKQHNYITLNKGRKDKVLPDRGIISKDGVIGIVTNVSSGYASGMSVLNRRTNISAKLKRNNYFGSITWDGHNYQYVQLKEIPLHVELFEGDTVVTSGYSSYFPEGIPIGVIQSFDKEGGDNFYSISVKLAVDFKSISFVNIIENTLVNEIQELEKEGNINENLD